MENPVRWFIFVAVLLFVTGQSGYSCINNPPEAILYSCPEPVRVNQEVLLDGSDSYDPYQGDHIKKYEWDFTNNGPMDYYETATHRPDGAFDGKTTHIYRTSGTYCCLLRVQDYLSNLYDVDMILITVIDNVQNITKQKQYSAIQPAIDDADDGDEIVVLTGRYYEQIDFKGKAITLRSADPNDPNIVAATIIDANNTSYGSEVVTFNSNEEPNSVLAGFTLTGGWRGVYCGWENPASPTITKCNITANAYFGLWCGSGSLDVSGCRIYDNSYGGIHTGASSSVIKNCIIVNNGQYGLYVGQALVDVINCVIAGHTNYGIYTPCHSVKNCIIWDNAVDLYMCNATYSCIKQPEQGVGNFYAEPLFIDSNNGDYHLDIRSFCIDAGDPNSDYSNEQSGGGGRVNVGAYGNTAQASVRIDSDADGIPDQWELKYWPDDLPAQHDPNDDPDADGYNNRTEYIFGYNPNEVTAYQPEILSPICFRQINPVNNETMSFEYYVNTDANVTVSFVNSDNSSDIVRTIEQKAAAGISNSVAFDGRGADGSIVERYFYDINIYADDANGHTATWQSPDGTNTYILGQLGTVDSSNFDPYKNIPVKITRDVYKWGKAAIKIVRNGDHDTIIYDRDFTKFVSPGQKDYYWYGRWDSDVNDPNYNRICTDKFDVYFFDAGPVDKGVVLVYYDDFLSNLRCNPYSIIPSYDEVTKISYDLAADANVTIDITDPDGNYFMTLADDEFQSAGHKEVIWYGTDSNPDSAKISKEGVYMIEVYIKGTDEKLFGSIAAYK